MLPIKIVVCYQSKQKEFSFENAHFFIFVKTFLI